MISDHADGKLKMDDINQDLVGRYLYTGGMPDPDLLIRTSGEYRISNFLYGNLPMQNYILRTFCGRISRKTICSGR